MRFAIVFVPTVHGLIHRLRFAKAFGYTALPQLVSRSRKRARARRGRLRCHCLAALRSARGRQSNFWSDDRPALAADDVTLQPQLSNDRCLSARPVLDDPEQKCNSLDSKPQSGRLIGNSDPSQRCPQAHGRGSTPAEAGQGDQAHARRCSCSPEPVSAGSIWSAPRRQVPLKPPIVGVDHWPGLPVRGRSRQQPFGSERSERPVFEAPTSGFWHLA
jgi:hypothetical protein